MNDINDALKFLKDNASFNEELANQAEEEISRNKSSQTKKESAVISNFKRVSVYDEEKKKDVEIDEYLESSQIYDRVLKYCGACYFRLGGSMYYVSQEKYQEVKKPDIFFATLMNHTRINWKSQGPGVSKSEFFHYCRMNLPKYDGICCVNQYPPQDKVKYLKWIKPENNGRSRELINRFYNPADEYSRIMLHATLISPMYSLPGKPCIILDTFTGGQNSGKTATAKSLASVFPAPLIRLSEEYFKEKSFKPDKPLEALLDNENLVSPIALIDNISHDLGGANFAEMITASSFSARTTYAPAESRRVNNVTFIGTTNYHKVSRDAATRIVWVKLNPAPLNGYDSWQSRISKFIEEHAQEIMADCLYILQQKVNFKLNQRPRNENWYLDIVSKLCSSQEHFDELINQVMEQSQLADSSRESAEEFETKVIEFICSKPELNAVKMQPLGISKSVLLHIAEETPIFGNPTRNRVYAKIAEWLKSGLFSALNVINNSSERVWQGSQRGYLIGCKHTNDVQFNIEMVQGKVVARPRPSTEGDENE